LLLIPGRGGGDTPGAGAATFRGRVAAPTADLRVRRGAVTAGTSLVGVTVVWATALVGLAGAAVVARRHRPDAGGRWHPRALAAGLRGRDAWAAAATLRVRGPRTLAADLLDRLRVTVSALRERIAALLAERDAAAPTPEVTGGTADHAGPTEPDDVPAAENEVYRAWATFTAGLDVDSESPATVAERAKRAGLPDAAVADLVTNFRAVRYGGADATADRERRAHEALARIQESSR
jgi:hypothetical protein